MNNQELYKSKLVSKEEIGKLFKDNWVVGMDSYCSQTDGIMDSLCEYALAGNVKGVKVHGMLEGYPLPFLTKPELNGLVNGVIWFASVYSRKAINAGYAEFVPSYYRDIPSIMRQYYDYDVCCISVPPMDENGDFSLACVGSYLDAVLDKSKRIFLEVNEFQPYVINNTKVNIKDVDAIIENSHPLPVFGETKLDEVSMTIGGLIAEQIPDGACIQLGIGAIPDAVGAALKQKHDLGIHTELFTDSMVELLLCGAANNSKKELNRGKTVTSIAFGSERIYKYLDRNEDIAIMPVDYVNDPAVICQHSNFISINSAVEVDLLGQVCSESIGTKHLSGTGGQVDYVRGACQSKGGKSFIAFASTVKGASKITSALASGAAVTTSKNDVDFIVTEYGIASLRGVSYSERAKRLIEIAHPDFRDQLRFEAKQRGLLV